MQIIIASAYPELCIAPSRISSEAIRPRRSDGPYSPDFGSKQAALPALILLFSLVWHLAYVKGSMYRTKAMGPDPPSNLIWTWRSLHK